MMLTCDASVVVKYDRRRSRLRNAAMNMKYDDYRTEIQPSKHTTYNIAKINMIHILIKIFDC